MPTSALIAAKTRELRLANKHNAACLVCAAYVMEYKLAWLATCGTGMAGAVTAPKS